MELFALGVVAFVCGGLIGAGAMALRAPEPIVVEVPVYVPPLEPKPPADLAVPDPIEAYHTCVLLDNGKRVIGVIQRPDVPREFVKYHGRQPSETFRHVGQDGEGRQLYALVMHGVD